MGRIRILNSALNCLKFICAVLLFYVTIFALVTVLAITLPYKIFVFILAKTHRPHLLSFVHGQCGFMAVDPLHTQPTYNLIYIFVLDGIIPLSKFREIFQERIINKRQQDPSNDLVYGRFQQYWVNFMGYNFWRWDPEFSIKNHIKQCLKSKTYTKKDLPQIMSDLVPKPFKRGQSPWEITLIQNYKENGQASSIGSAGNEPGKMVVILKIHHAMADGYSLLNVFQFDLPLRMDPLNIAKPTVSLHQPFWNQFYHLHLSIWEFMNFLIESYDPKNTWIYPKQLKSNGSVQKYYTSITSGIEVSEVIGIKNKYNVSYAAVLIHCIFEGTRRAMEYDGQSVPDKIGVGFLRPKPNHPGGLINHVYGGMIVLPMKKMSAELHLKEIESIIVKEKRSMLPIVMDTSVHIISFLPKALIHFLANKILPPSFGFSNFPVPKDVTSFEGAQVTGVFVGIGSISRRRAVMVMAFGDGGKQSIVVHVDESSYSSQEAFQKLGNYIKDEFNFLAASLQRSE